MGRNKFSQKEIDAIGKLLKIKCAGTRFQQKQVRHKLRVEYEFNISDFGVQGEAFGYEQLQESIRRGRIQILDQATIDNMLEKRRRDKLRDAQSLEAEQIATGQAVDWRKVLEEWENQQNANPSSEE